VTLVADPTPPPPDADDAVPTPTTGGRLRRAWARPLWAHVVALGLVLIALMPVVGTHASFSADEGAAITQARNLARGDGWIVDHPLPQVDPEGVNYPLELSSRGPNGVAPFAKHPLYALVLAGAERVGGINAMVALTLLGTLAAAALGAALASRMGGPGLARPALWALGLASPLLFDGYLVVAHTIGAALAAAAVLVAVVAIERRRASLALAVAPLVALAVLFRTEALLFGVALAVMAGLLVLRRPGATRWTTALVAAASLAGAGGAAIGERLWSAAILGGPAGSTGGGPSGLDEVGFFDGRMHGFVITWLRPSYDGGAVDIALLVMAAALALGVFAARRHPGDDPPARLLAVVAAIASILALAVGPTAIVPGLLVACPLVLVGLASFGRGDRGTDRSSDVDSPSRLTATLAAGTFAGFALAVIATQYATGGSGEWGGRYFAIGLPILVPVCLLNLRRVGQRLSAPTRRVAAGSLLVCTVCLSTIGVSGLRHTHDFTGRLMAAVDRTASPIGARPVIVTDEPGMPRQAWDTFDRQQWLLVDDEEPSDVFDRLRAAGIERVAVVFGPGKRDLTRDLGPGAQVVAADAWAESKAWHIVTVDLG
jgi:hypothetical protein